MSARSNWAYVSMPGTDADINQDTYNNLHQAESQSSSTAFEGKTLYVSMTSVSSLIIETKILIAQWINRSSLRVRQAHQVARRHLDTSRAQEMHMN